MSRMLVILNQILAFILLAQTSLQTRACSCQIKPWLIVDLYRFNSIIFCSEPPLQIFWFKNRNSFVFKLWSSPVIFITRCLCILSSSGWVSILTSDLLWTAISLVGLLSNNVLRIQITLWFPRIYNACGKLYPLLCEPCSTFELVLFTLETCGICF